LFKTKESLIKTIENDELGESLDGIWLVQEYVEPTNGRIVRAEFVGGKFLYAVSIDASKGFQLCPADSCNIEDDFCPAGESSHASKFIILNQYENDELSKYTRFLKANDIGIGAMEYIQNNNGQRIVYDVNTNTNYNSGAEATFGNQVHGMFEIAKYLGEELRNRVERRKEAPVLKLSLG